METIEHNHFTRPFIDIERIVADYEGPEPFNSALDASDMLTELVAVLRPLVADDGLVSILFRWNPEHGHCTECGLPAAFWSPTMYGRYNPDGHDGCATADSVPKDDEKMCAVCAANQAAGGEEIRRIEELG